MHILAIFDKETSMDDVSHLRPDIKRNEGDGLSAVHFNFPRNRIAKMNLV